MDVWRVRDSRPSRSPFRSVLRARQRLPASTPASTPRRGMGRWTPGSRQRLPASSPASSPASTPLLRPRLTSRAAASTSPLQARGEIAPGKHDGLLSTTAGSTTTTLGHESFAVVCPLAGRRRLVSGSCSSARRCVPRFLQPAPREANLALPFGPCGQVPRGLPPRGHRPCWAHKHTHRASMARRLLRIAWPSV